jgi:hypothetical protein
LMKETICCTNNSMECENVCFLNIDTAIKKITLMIDTSFKKKTSNTQADSLKDVFI